MDKISGVLVNVKQPALAGVGVQEAALGVFVDFCGVSTPTMVNFSHHQGVTESRVRN